MSCPPFTSHQAQLVLSVCGARLARILARSRCESASPHIFGAALHAELHDIVVHAVVALRPPVPNAGRYRSMLTRAYADGGNPTGALTAESVESISVIIRTVIANLHQAR